MNKMRYLLVSIFIILFTLGCANKKKSEMPPEPVEMQTPTETEESIDTSLIHENESDSIL